VRIADCGILRCCDVAATITKEIPKSQNQPFNIGFQQRLLTGMCATVLLFKMKYSAHFLAGTLRVTERNSFSQNDFAVAIPWGAACKSCKR